MKSLFLSGLLFLAGFMNPAFGQNARTIRTNSTLSCNGILITSRTVGAAINHLNALIRDASDDNAVEVYKYLVSSESTLAEHFASQSTEFERRLNFVQQYAESNFSPVVAAKAARIIGSVDMCAPGYSCGAGSVGNWNNCNGCEYEEVVPRTNPRTCNYSCAMCCAHYGNPGTCATSCPAGDPC